MQPGGMPPPYNPQPPQSPVVYPIGYDFSPGQLPGDPGAGTGTPAGGDTQVGYPDGVLPSVSWMPAYAAGTPLVVTYTESGASATPIADEGHGLPPIKLYLGEHAAGPAIPGSVRFSFRGRTYVDRAGALYYGIDAATNTGTLGGNYDYDHNVATLTEYGSGSNTVTVHGLATRYGALPCSGIMFRTNGAPLREGSLTLQATTTDGTQLIASVNVNGDITGGQIKGRVDWPTGLVRVAFGAPVTAAGNESEPWYDAALVDGTGKIWRPTTVDPESIRFGTVIYRAIPVDPDLIGIDPVRLPSDGRVLGFQAGGIGVVSHTQTTSLTPTAGLLTDLGRTRLAYVDILDSAGLPIDEAWYTLDMDAGTVQWATSLNLSAYTLPVLIRDRIQDIGLITDVQVTGEISLGIKLTHDFPAGTILSSAILVPDKQARVTNLYDQATYQAGVWSDVVVGNPAQGTYNAVTYPLAVTNNAAIDDRWAIVFRSPTTVDVIGETVGQVLTGVAIDSTIAPINPVTIDAIGNPGGAPYFTLDKNGWGGGWAAGNVLRFNTVSATFPIWLSRVIKPGALTSPTDQTRLQLYGNAH